jgi:hypothetical protein
VANGEGVTGISIDLSKGLLLLGEELESELVLLLGAIRETEVGDVFSEGRSESIVVVADLVFDTNEGSSVAE